MNFGQWGLYRLLSLLLVSFQNLIRYLLLKICLSHRTQRNQGDIDLKASPYGLVGAMHARMPLVDIIIFSES